MKNENKFWIWGVSWIFGIAALLLLVAADLVPGLRLSQRPHKTTAPDSALIELAVTNESPATNYSISVAELAFQFTNGLGAGGDPGGTNARQYGALNLTNWSTIPTGAMGNVVSTDFLTNWANAISNYATAATNAAQVTNWITSRQPADTDLTNWSLIPTGVMANVVSTSFLTNWANAVSNYVTASTNSASVTNWINSRQPASANLTNWSLIPTGVMANVVAVDFLTNWINAVSNRTGPFYLRAGFASDSDTTLRMLKSEDGINWRCYDTNCSILYTTPVTGAFSDVLRDPSITAYSNRIYCTYTSQVLDPGNYFSIASSVDGLTWTFLAHITNTTVHGDNAIWAPEWFLDGAFVRIYWSRGDAGNQTGIWETHATTGLLNAWTPAAPVLTNGPYIDPCMVRLLGTNYLFFRDVNSNYIHRAWSTSPTNGFVIDKTGNWAEWGQNLEGPSIVQIATNRFRIYLENFNEEVYRYSESSNLLNWTTLVELGEQYKLRHGTIFPMWGTNTPHRPQVIPATAAGTNIYLSTVNGLTTFNVPTDFTNIYYVNKDNNLSSILTNVPNNSTIWIGSGIWTNQTNLYIGSSHRMGDLYLANKTNITIKAVGEAILSNAFQGDMIILSNCNRITIDGLHFYGRRTSNENLTGNYAAVFLDRCRNITLQNCFVQNWGNHCFLDGASGVLGRTSTNTVARWNYFYNCGNWYPSIGSYDGSPIQCGGSWHIYGNYIDECARGIEIYGPDDPIQSQTIVENNYFRNVIDQCVFDAGRTNNYNTVVRNNTFFSDDRLRLISSNLMVAAYAINFNSCRNLTIEGNNIIGYATPFVQGATAIGVGNHGTSLGSTGLRIIGNVITNCEFGIQLVNGTDMIRDVTIRDNYIAGSYYASMRIMNGTDVDISGNRITDPNRGGSTTQGAIYLTFGATTNVTIYDNAFINSPGYSPPSPAITVDSVSVGVRIFDNRISTAYTIPIVDNGLNSRPAQFIDMITGIATNPFVIYNTNRAPVVAFDSRGFLLITNSLTNRVAAPTNTIAIGADNFGGMNLPNWTDHNGLQSALQPFLGHEQVYWLSTSAGAMPGAEGLLPTTNGGAVISHTTPIETQPYMVVLDAAATSNSCASIFSSADLANAGAHNGSSKIGGYFFAATWASTNLIAQIVGGGAPRTFIGLTAKAAEDYTNIVVTTNSTGQYVGLMCDASQSTNMFLTARDASAEFRTNTGMPFIATNIYKFYMFNAPTSRFVNWRLDDAFSGASARGWFSNNVPTNFMKFGAATKNGTNRAHSIRYSRIYLQAPLVPPR